MKLDAVSLELSGQPIMTELFEGDAEGIVVEVRHSIAVTSEGGFDPFHRPAAQTESMNEHGFGGRLRGRCGHG